VAQWFEQEDSGLKSGREAELGKSGSWITGFGSKGVSEMVMSEGGVGIGEV
jgi:hypothetical protein